MLFPHRKIRKGGTEGYRDRSRATFTVVTSAREDRTDMGVVRGRNSRRAVLRELRAGNLDFRVHATSPINHFGNRGVIPATPDGEEDLRGLNELIELF